MKKELKELKGEV